KIAVIAENPVTAINNEHTKSSSLDISYGLGTKAIPFLIKTAEDMHELSRKVAAGNLYKNYYFKVDDGITELDLGNFIPIGNASTTFQGTFNGNGVNFKVAIDTSISYVGIFGYVSNLGVVHNFSVSGSVKGTDHVGAIVGMLNNGTVFNVYNTAKVQGNSNVGGLIGNLYIGTLRDGFNMGNIKGATNVGGIVGSTMRYASSQYQVNHTNDINNVYSAGEVSATGTVGGAIGYDNAARYSTASANARTNIWYDVTVTANYDQDAGYKKPSSLRETLYALDSGELFTKMSGKLDSDWYFKEKDDTYAYYPQLIVFSSHEEQAIRNLSEETVKVDVSEG